MLQIEKQPVRLLRMRDISQNLVNLVCYSHQMSFKQNIFKTINVFGNKLFHMGYFILSFYVHFNDSKYLGKAPIGI